jgi:hypothetical protein
MGEWCTGRCAPATDASGDQPMLRGACERMRQGNVGIGRSSRAVASTWAFAALVAVLLAAGCGSSSGDVVSAGVGSAAPGPLAQQPIVVGALAEPTAAPTEVTLAVAHNGSSIRVDEGTVIHVRVSGTGPDDGWHAPTSGDESIVRTDASSDTALVDGNAEGDFTAAAAGEGGLFSGHTCQGTQCASAVWSVSVSVTSAPAHPVAVSPRLTG